ncbi:MAG: orotidine-5'-phosphate decarboxylase [Sulfobacillus acidophilus]|uniref:Orotidine 5'-phosphate decarboxylase n=1 Tax=Sulfobacillus acidophilus TaxID=53633 RepID=A0A2T2WFG6_9FIRM|nr:MAG: orotidine-5'-phosphate decarboxylase [Sulfobacillus acidophilus]
MKPTIWVALDVSTKSEADKVLGAIWPHRHIKIGMELFYRLGPDYVRQLVRQDVAVFLDLKCHDIPRTVAKAAQAADDLGAELLTVHVAGGIPMMAAAQQRALRLDLVGVTVLTSLDDQELARVGIVGGVTPLVAASARAARIAGIAGLVCSGQEVPLVRQVWPGARLVVPGIRQSGQGPEDQRRVVSPLEAYRLGATDLVVGRAVVQQSDPAAALRRIQAELQWTGEVGDDSDV